MGLDRPVLNPAYVAVASDPNTVRITTGPWAGTVLTIQETESEESIERLFAKLDGEHTLESILEPYDAEDRNAILGLFEQLRNKNVIYDAAEWNGAVGRPQIEAVDGLGGRMESLSEQTVLVVGVGEIGPQIAADLVRAGVGSVWLDRPISDDLDRDPDPMGLLDRLDEHDAFDRHDGDLREALSAVDVAVLATDGFRHGVASTFNEFAHDTGTPWMLAQIRGYDGLVGPVVYPGETACYACLEQRIEANVSDPDSYVAPRDGAAGQPSLSPVGLPSFARTVAGYATVDLLYLLAYGQAFTTGRTITVDFTDLSTEVNEVLKAPRCSVCGKPAGEDVKRHVTVDELLTSDRWNRQFGRGE